jgi:NADH-ubiquinone oxidoreductase chain 5
MTKRAQIPFSAWLPAAIAAPTPVSALVHSSTLVTAGVYLILRFFPLFQFRFMKTVLLFRATLTIMISSLGALYETDLKKVIALSTLRQLGLIMIALRIEMYLLAFFHLLTHALFKASLFLCAGRIIHLYGGRQDIRNLSAVVTYIPLTTTCLLVCSLSLGGFPFLAAFYSKDKIIEETLRSGYNPLLLSLLAISILLTIMYSFRLVYHIACRSCEINYLDIKDDKIIVKSILILTLGGIVGGSFFSWSIFDTSYDNLFLRAKSLILLFLLLGLFRGLVLSISSFRVIRFYLREIWFLPAFRTKLTTLGGLSYSSSRFKY